MCILLFELTTLSLESELCNRNNCLGEKSI